MADNKLISSTEEYTILYDRIQREHVPVAGDVYIPRNPCFNSREAFSLVRKKENGAWIVNPLEGFPQYRSETISEDTLRKYYRLVVNKVDDVVRLAGMVLDGKTSEAASLITGEEKEVMADSEELMATETPEHISAMLDKAERMQVMMRDVREMADLMVEVRKAELEKMLDGMTDYLGKVNKQVRDLVKVITVLNLYTGKTVDIHRIAEGEGAPVNTPLNIRQRILFMDEEICVHLDHEADYQDVDAFFEWLKEPANRDIVVPEERCVVCLKPKRFDMDYRSGDPVYDARRNRWNKHTYVVIRNGENLFWFESDDLEVCDWVFPHEDFEEKFREDVSGRKSFIEGRYENARYRVVKFMMFLQGLIDQRPDIIGPSEGRINVAKLNGVTLVRDDENLIGTGRKNWREFRKEKNDLIRRGTRIVYIGGGYYYTGRASGKQYNGGDFLKYYTHEYSRPEAPGTGLYSADSAAVVHHYENGKPVMAVYPKLVFRYLPGDTLWDRTEGEHERRNRVSWVYDPDYVLNYDAVTLEELQGYLEDRTLRAEFASMIPVLLKMKFYKMAERKDEEAFKALMEEDILRETGKRPSPEAVDDAVGWWKGKVIFTRPLRSDDRKAWRMIRSRLIGKGD